MYKKCCTRLDRTEAGLPFESIYICGASWMSKCVLKLNGSQPLTHWGRVTHICVGKLTILGSDNGLSPGRRQAIIWTNAGMLLIEPSWTNFSEILFRIQTFSFKKMRLKMSAKWRPFCHGLNVLTHMDMTYIWKAQTKLKRRNRLLYYYHCFISKFTYAYIANIIFTKW